MGWKALKEAFNMDNHHVVVTDKGICVGSQLVEDLARIDPQTGEIHEHPTYDDFLIRKYPELLESSPSEILKLIKTLDTFSASIPVYTYRDGEIIEKLCEEPGYPNVTHDGCLMHSNTYSTDKAQVIEWAKEDARIYADALKGQIDRLEQELAARREDLARVQDNLAALDASLDTNKASEADALDRRKGDAQ